MPKVLLVDRDRVQSLILDEIAFVKSVVYEAFRIYHEKLCVQPPKQYLQENESSHTADRIISMSAYIKGDSPISGIKWIGSKHTNPRLVLNRASALVILNDPETNFPIAILDGSLISAMRTVAVSLIAIERLKPDVKSVACIGMGRLGKLHARIFSAHYPSIEHIFCYSKHAPFDELLSMRAIVKSKSLKKVFDNSEVVITTTVADKPYIRLKQIGEEKLMINLSLMDFHLEVYQNSEVVVDDWTQCTLAKKVLRQGIEKGLIKQEDVFELSDTLFGKSKKYRFSKRIIVNPLGMAIEDILLAWEIFQRLKSMEQLPSFDIE